MCTMLIVFPQHNYLQGLEYVMKFHGKQSNVYRNAHASGDFVYWEEPFNRNHSQEQSEPSKCRTYEDEDSKYPHAKIAIVALDGRAPN